MIIHAPLPLFSPAEGGREEGVGGVAVPFLPGMNAGPSASDLRIQEEYPQPVNGYLWSLPLSMSKTFYLIDGHAQIYRAFYAPFGELTSPSGEPTRATYVFCHMLLALIRDKAPDYLAIALDSRDETVFRCDIDPNYKANREAAPEGLHLQADRIIAIVEMMGIQTFRREGFEADDLIATIAEKTRDLDVAT